MKRWTILTSILIIGIAIAVGVWFFVRATTSGTRVDTTPTSEQRGFLSFFGDTFGFSDDETPVATTTPVETPAGPSFRERLRRAQMLPIGNTILAGATFTTTIEVSTTTGATTTEEFVRFVERETGHINDISLETGEELRVTNTTIPAIQEVLWGENGSSVALRYLTEDNETIETYVARLKTTMRPDPYDLTGIFFPQNISSFSLSATGSEAFFMTMTQNQGVGKLSTLTNQNQKTVFASPLREWVSSWETSEEIFVTSKPSVSAAGVSYALQKDGGATRVISGNGLTVLPSPSGTRVLYTTASQNTLRSFVLTRATQETKPLSVRTLPEKCVWRDDDVIICAIPDNIPANTPDAWYQGNTSFNDSIWVIDVANEIYDFLYAPEDTDANQTMDIINLDLSDDGTILSLINKKDLRGWVADVSPVVE
ncbi:MAG: hypothetical protein RLY47_236 [Candidatus Parcubacteria bacterium]|jgi:hypothetical protein